MTSRNRSLLPAMIATLIVVDLTFFSMGWAGQELPEGLPGRGAIIPSFTIPAPSDPADKAYLMLNGKQSFQPAELKTQLVLIEVFNVYCASCQYMRPYMNELYEKIERAPDLKGRIKMIGIGAGNDHWDIDLELESYKFPIIPDDDYVFHRLVGKPPTPFLIFAKPYTGGRLLVVSAHLGRLEDSEKLLAMTRAALNTDISEIIGVKREQGNRETETEPEIPVSEKELMKKVRASLRGKGEKEPGEIKTLILPGLGRVYVSQWKHSKKKIFARVVAREIPCEDCHDVFFVYSFDDEGRFLRFIPISISKLDNEEWDENDVNRIRNRFKNESLLKEVPFRRDIDAVTSATISSEIIFNSMNKTRLVIKKLADLGYMNPAK